MYVHKQLCFSSARGKHSFSYLDTQILVLGTVDQVAAHVLQGANVPWGQSDTNAVHRRRIAAMGLLNILGSSSLQMWGSMFILRLCYIRNHNTCMDFIQKSVAKNAMVHNSRLYEYYLLNIYHYISNLSGRDSQIFVFWAALNQLTCWLKTKWEECHSRRSAHQFRSALPLSQMNMWQHK